MVLLLLATGCATRRADTTDARLDWWRDARLGLFIHWGPVSLRGTEIGWSRGNPVPEAEYDELYRSFNPTNFDARAWARLARDMGARYLVLTSKHHDGFCLWDSRYTDYDIAATPFRRDVVAELAAACRREGIVFCTYHSICDWRHADYPLGSPGGKTAKPSPDMDRYTTYLRNQVGELIRNYGPLGIMWFDGEWEAPWNEARGRELYDLCRSLQPSIIVNNRVAKGRQGMTGTTAAEAFAGDYDTPEQEVGKFQIDRPWESCITLCRQWAWKPDDSMKSLKECLQTLIQCAGGDGNLLFNVGPMPDGRVEPRQVERLEEMGAWLDAYGESIYKTRGGPFKPGRWGASTHRGRSVYLHVFRWPEEGLLLPAIPCRIRSAKVLTGGRVEIAQTEAGVRVTVPPGDRRDIDTVIRLKLDGEAAQISPVGLGSGSLAEGHPVRVSNVHQGSAEHAGSKAVDGDLGTRWATDGGTREAWLELDFGQPTSFSRIRIDEWEPGGKRVQDFELQVEEADQWTTIHRGTTIGPDWSCGFADVTARRVRLVIHDATDGPTLNEFQVLK